MNLDVPVNREFKDSLFSLLFGNENALVEVYNAIFGTNYGPGTEVRLTTLKNVLCRGLINDLSFVLDGRLVVLVEHQSTINENMPLRMLLYIAETYNRLLKEENLYSRKKFPIQRPVFVVLYNGVEDAPDRQVLRLSDMFMRGGGAARDDENLELIVTVYNINKGRNPEIARRSPTLDGYETFVYMVREYQKTMSLEEAVKKAVVDCINQNVLKEFLTNNKSEVINMLLQEWTLEKELEVTKKEAWEEGREEGWEEGVEEGIERGMERGIERGMERGMEEKARKVAEKMKNEGIDASTIARLTDLAIDDVLRL